MGDSEELFGSYDGSKKPMGEGSRENGKEEGNNHLRTFSLKQSRERGQ